MSSYTGLFSLFMPNFSFILMNYSLGNKKKNGLYRNVTEQHSYLHPKLNWVLS